MKKVVFQVSARAGKLLGRENFSNASGAIMELVKNSYDADASNCLIIFDIHKEAKINKSSLYIIDNGEGMTEGMIKKYWMEIGTGNKEENYLSTQKRVRTGAKGIGRFALDRLGSNTKMWTVPREKGASGTLWKMDWSQFDSSSKLISEIDATIESHSNSNQQILNEIFSENKIILKVLDDIKFTNGTVLKISNLKDEWLGSDIEKIFKDLEIMIPPKELNIAFDVTLHHAQNVNEFGDVSTAFFDDYDYKISAKYDAKKLEVNFEITRNELEMQLVKDKYSFIYKSKKSPFDLRTLGKKTFKFSKPVAKVLGWDLNKENKKIFTDVGSFELSFYYLKQTNSNNRHYPYPHQEVDTTQRKAVLKRFGGIKVYRDFFRVRPYGDPSNDWLHLGMRAAQSPSGAGQEIGAWRVRPESTAGIVTISRKTNKLLVDKSDRDGMENNEAFNVFSKIIIGMIHEFEMDRSRILNPYHLYFKEEKEKALQELIERKAEEMAKKAVEKKISVSNSDMSDDDKFSDEQEYKKAFVSTFKDIKEEDNAEIVQVRALASLGLIFSSFAHELREIKNNSAELFNLEKLFDGLLTKKQKNTIEFKDTKSIFKLMMHDSEKITHWLDYALISIKKDRRKSKKIFFAPYFVFLENNWRYLLTKKDVSIKINTKYKKNDYTFKTFPVDMDTIFNNLITNSIDSFEKVMVEQENVIKILFDRVGNTIEITYSDNGVGLPTIFKGDPEEILLPFTTSKKDSRGDNIGFGLGMYLAKEAINSNSGNLKILNPKNGFAVKMTFSIEKFNTA